MSTTSAGPIESTTPQEQRRVIFASSLGTVFEWYDFYLYATLAPFFAALFFPKGNDTAALLSAFATYAAGFLVRPFGALVFGRVGDLVGRKYTFLVTIAVMGAVDVRGRPAARPTTTIGIAGADAPRRAAAAAGPRARRRVRRRRDLRRRARAGRTPRLATQLDPDHRDARILPVAARDRRRRAALLDPTTFASWGWRIPFCFSLVLLAFSIYIRLKLERVAGVRAMKAEGTREQASADRELPALSEQQARPARAPRRDRRARRGLVHGPVLRAVLPRRSRSRSTTSPRTSSSATSLLIGTPFFVVFGKLSDRDRPEEDHPRGLSARRGRVLPAVPRPRALRESGARGIRREHADHRRRERLPLAHLRVSEHGVHACDKATRFPDARPGLSFELAAGGRRRGRRDAHR